MKLTNKTIITVLTLAAVTSVSSGAISLINVNSSTASTTASPYVVSRTHDNSGLSATLTPANIASVTHTNSTTNNNAYWLSSLNNMASNLTYTFASASDLTGIYFWNLNRDDHLDRGIQSYDVLVSTGGLYTEILSNQILAQAGGTTTEPSQFLAIDAADGLGVTSVRIHIDSSRDTQYSGLSEIAFISGTVPEPSSTALLGLGGLALILRRRKYSH